MDLHWLEEEAMGISVGGRAVPRLDGKWHSAPERGEEELKFTCQEELEPRVSWYCIRFAGSLWWALAEALR